MRRSVTGMGTIDQITVVHRRMTAAASRKRNTRLEAIPHCLKVKKHTSWKQRRRECPNKQGSLQKRSQVRLELWCQVPRAIQASSGYVDGLPGQLSWLVVNSGDETFKGNLLQDLSFWKFIYNFCARPTKMKTHAAKLIQALRGNEAFVQTVTSEQRREKYWRLQETIA